MSSDDKSRVSAQTIHARCLKSRLLTTVNLTWSASRLSSCSGNESASPWTSKSPGWLEKDAVPPWIRRDRTVASSTGLASGPDVMDSVFRV